MSLSAMHLCMAVFHKLHTVFRLDFLFNLLNFKQYEKEYQTL